MTFNEIAMQAPSAYVLSCCGGNEAIVDAILRDAPPLLAMHVVKPAFDQNWPREGVYRFVCAIVAALGRAPNVLELERSMYVLAQNLQSKAHLVQLAVCTRGPISGNLMHGLLAWTD